MLKCTKFDLGWGSAPDPLAGFKAPTSKGREVKMEGRGRMGSGGKNEGPTTTKGERRIEVDRREGKGGKGSREEEGICRTNVKLLPMPLQKYSRICEISSFLCWGIF